MSKENINLEDFYKDLPAIWLVFANSYLKHKSAPRESPDLREKTLVDLLGAYLKTEISKQSFKESTISQLTIIQDLLELWSKDLKLIYHIRDDSHVEEVAKRFLQRIETFDNCTIIPNGLISAGHTEKYENISLAILKKCNTGIDWIQVNPGGLYHQCCPSLAGEKSNAYLEITGIDVNDITEEWLYLLVGLKALKVGADFYYKEASLYACLLANLNGKTTFQSHPDESFVYFSHTSPIHMWQVINESFRYMLKHFLGDIHHSVYWKLLIGFKLFLIEKTFIAYQEKANKRNQQCHYLLQEMCRQVAQETLDHGNPEQIVLSLKLIDSIKAVMKKRYDQQNQKASYSYMLNDPVIDSVCFTAPNLIRHCYLSNNSTLHEIQTDSIFIKRNPTVDIIDYLKKFKQEFIGALIDSKELKDIALMSYGIEIFLIDDFAMTGILEKSGCPFSKDDLYLAKTLIEFAEIYYTCQKRIVDCLSNSTYQPQFYVKNITIQFFVYAVVTALNLRDKKIGQLLSEYNLSTASSKTLAFDSVLPHLVITDSRYLNLLFIIQTFFKSAEDKKVLFSFNRCSNSMLKLDISNDADESDIDVAFAYALLKKDIQAYRHFIVEFQALEDENLNLKWSKLTYSDAYLPELYMLLSKIAYFAKASLTGFPFSAINKQITSEFYIYKSSYWHWTDKDLKQGYYIWQSSIRFKINGNNVITFPDSSNELMAYLTKSRNDGYQRLIICKDNIGKADAHLSENEIIASQDEKPLAMDCVQYMHLGFLQSEPWIKIERLYIAIKDQQLDFNCDQESTLIKQTLFEVSIRLKCMSILQHTVQHNSNLIHKLGLLCVDKALSMKYRLTQHPAISEILEVVLGLLTFYPPEYKDEFIEHTANIYYMLKAVLDKPPTHLNEITLLHLNAYLIISIQAKPELLIETDCLTILTTFLAIQNYKVQGFLLDNRLLLRMHISSFIWSPLMICHLQHHSTLLNDLLLSVIPQWNPDSIWQKSCTGLLFTCNGYKIKPLAGLIYFQNRPIMGLPDTITSHRIYKEYLGMERFTVIPGSRSIGNTEVDHYVSVDREPQVRLTLTRDNLLIEEWIDGKYQLFLSSKDLLGCTNYSCLLYKQAHNNELLTHWLNNDNKILIKNLQHQIIYKWNLKKNTIFSVQHKGNVVPWKQLQSSNFKIWLAQIELPVWIEIIVKQSFDCSAISIKSLHFPRFGLDFDVTQGVFFSRQIYHYYLAKQQYLNILQAFSNYFILEKKNENSPHKLIKVVIPHRKIRLSGEFYDNTAIADLETVLSPSYFVYDLDQKTGLLKANNIRAQLYLALLYFCSSSFDDNDMSHCNAYHLARENLEICWKDQPYDRTELDIIEQLLNPATMRDYHSHRIALYLKSVTLLSSSLTLAFLYTDKAAVENKKRSEQILNKCCLNLSNFFTLYLQNRPSVFARIKLNVEEEKEILKHCKKFDEYYQLYYENQPQVSLTNVSRNRYKICYQQLFTKEILCRINFLDCFMNHITFLNFSYDNNELNFSTGINGILIDRFRLIHFITLYKIAKSSTVSIRKYCYLLHHLVLRAVTSDEIFPNALAMMLAKALLLVAKNPEIFFQAPKWFTYGLSVDLHKRNLTKMEVINEFPKFYWVPDKTYKTRTEEIKASNIAEDEYKKENYRIWLYLKKFDLDTQGIPLNLPDLNNSKLNYEFHIQNWCVLQNISLSSKYKNKQDIVWKLYLQAARNNAMYTFFVHVLQQCDKLKYNSDMGWIINPCFDSNIVVTIKPDKLPVLLTEEEINLETKAVLQQPLVDLTHFFIVEQQSFESHDFIFESQLEGPSNGYQQQFYRELKNSWVVYHNEGELSYNWINTQAMGQLETYLQAKYIEMHKQADTLWDCISKRFSNRPNSKLDNYFALRWHSGLVPHYHKGDLITLLIKPHNLLVYNPSCLQKKDTVIQDLLHYVNHEINATKIVNLLTLIHECKQVENESEHFSLLQCLVRNLQENLDPASYRYPHWLLFQLENDVIVRYNQRELILEMLNQTEKVMYQLNMGEGKSSVILPLLCYNLANGQQVLRINVLSSLLITMKDFLCQRFSGLIRKHIYSLPFCRDTDISTKHLMLILEALTTCQTDQHILLVTPEYRLCLQLKIRELMIENQQQIGATDLFNWKTYRQRVHCVKAMVYDGLTEEQTDELLTKQDKALKTCLLNEKYIDNNNRIIRVPPRGQGRKEFARFKEIINDSTLREWSCLKAAYRELLYNSKLAYVDSSDKLAILNKINELATIDLLDESDEILKHGTELNYTLGDKYMFSGGELRWKIPQFFIETIFCDPKVRDIIILGEKEGFTVINVSYSSLGGVPFIQLFNKSYYEKHIKPLLIEKFFLEHLLTLRKYNLNTDDSLIKGELSSLRYYVAGKLPLDTEKKIVTVLADKGSLKDKLLIAKGWLSHGILFHVFNSKYRVQYGLALNLNGRMHKQIAIPFWGKDMPSPRSEFSHPDVMLGFTIISYLYQGLNKHQLKQTLLRLKKKFSCQVADTNLKNWAEASRSWIEPQTNQFPPILLTSFEDLDLADEQCLAKVHQYLSCNHPAIFFYVNQFVLIEEAMQYHYKISANSHSLAGYGATLGFSGTDDRKLTMPFQVKSLRPMTQQGTNGKMLTILAEERNRCYYSLKIGDSTDLLIELCQYIEEKPHCHALIDAGALVTGLSNYQVATFLMDKLPNSFLGILYFSDEGNVLTVLTQDQKTVAMQDCYLDKQFLFAYFDDVHTRGTDIKLPLNCHAILTIGMGMQKDKLMQAAMRLRQLAKKQSVSLWGTHTVTLAIARDNHVDISRINSLEVMQWATQNTVTQINNDLFPVLLRKINFQFLKKSENWLREAPTTIDTLIKYCQQKELFALEDFYALSPQREDLCDRLYLLVAARIKTFWQDLENELMKKHLTDTAFHQKIFNQSDKENFRVQLYTICNELAPYLKSDYVHPSLDDDEEKEVEVEIIQEQQVVIKRVKRDIYLEKIWDAKLILRKKFLVTAEQKGIIMSIKDIKNFVQQPVNFKNIIWHNDIYMTSNFVNTVKSMSNEAFDNYLRPVDVVLIHRLENKSVAVLLTGKEASNIKSQCYSKLNSNLLIHIRDIDGPTVLPIKNILSKQEGKLLTIIKLFSGECQYTSSKEVKRLAKRVGRVYPDFFTSSDNAIDNSCSDKLYDILIKKGYLDFAGIMTEKLSNVFLQLKEGETPSLKLTSQYEKYSHHILKKLYAIYNKLIIHYSCPLKPNHCTLVQWIGTRGRQKQYEGSELQSILNPEYQLKC